ncbi:ADP-ribosylation factor-like [Bufo bufo]|uniref:ADP-ribosylation factor-like n=1 Tax=Bufo bufo TaxID=8384 RepID=UPI001ABE6D7B|nr:ADP-ribosylation factor-like [Bufo bufo]
MGTLVSRVQGLCRRTHLREAAIVMIGLDGSGKTTILYRLKLNETVKTIATVGFNRETLDIFEDLSLLVWDVSLGAMGWPLKRHFLEGCQGFLFVVDSKDTEIFKEVQEKLQYTVHFLDTQDLPFIVLANKQDLDGACSPSELVLHLNLDKFTTKKWDVCGCSGITGEGLHEALEKLCKMIKENEEH